MGARGRERNAKQGSGEARTENLPLPLPTQGPGPLLPPAGGLGSPGNYLKVLTPTEQPRLSNYPWSVNCSLLSLPLCRNIIASN